MSRLTKEMIEQLEARLQALETKEQLPHNHQIYRFEKDAILSFSNIPHLNY